MDIVQLRVPGAFCFTPKVYADERGAFLEWFRHEALERSVGHPLELAQANASTSRRGVVRGIHYADVPPGQAKYVTCVSGSVLDVVVDLRVGSPTFGRHDTVLLDDVDRRAVYLPEGVGHGFCATSEQATVVYLCSTVYRPAGEHGIDPLDPELGIAWPTAAPVLSAKDAQAPSLAAALAAQALPRWEDCQAYTDQLRVRATEEATR